MVRDELTKQNLSQRVTVILTTVGGRESLTPPELIQTMHPPISHDFSGSLGVERESFPGRRSRLFGQLSDSFFQPKGKLQFGKARMCNFVQNRSPHGFDACRTNRHMDIILFETDAR